MESRYFSEKVVEWYETHKRDLPWRDTRDPYKIWLSEIILQQTRVIQGLPYYLKFVDAFPDVTALANASEENVLRLWQGLGYYTRARNLHKCAQAVVKEWSGTFPDKYDDLLKLPGIGEYTAAAIASFSTGEKVAVLDGNVFRVLSRISGEATPINSAEGKKRFSILAAGHMPPRNVDTYNQAVMEFGALWCTPRQPRCEECFYRIRCFANVHGLQEQLPVKIAKQKSRRRYFTYFVVRNGENLLMKKRVNKDIWKGLYDFYLVETDKPITADKLLKADPFLKKISSGKPDCSPHYQHILTHQTIVSQFVLLNARKGALVEESEMAYYGPHEIQRLPKPVLISRFLKDYNFL